MRGSGSRVTERERGRARGKRQVRQKERARAETPSVASDEIHRRDSQRQTQARKQRQRQLRSRGEGRGATRKGLLARALCSYCCPCRLCCCRSPLPTFLSSLDLADFLAPITVAAARVIALPLLPSVKLRALRCGGADGGLRFTTRLPLQQGCPACPRSAPDSHAHGWMILPSLAPSSRLLDCFAVRLILAP